MQLSLVYINCSVNTSYNSVISVQKSVHFQHKALKTALNIMFNFTIDQNWQILHVIKNSAIQTWVKRGLLKFYVGIDASK